MQARLTTNDNARIDGGTAFGVWAPVSTWHPRLAAIVADAQRVFEDQFELDRVRRTPPVIVMPLPPLPAPHQRGLAGVLEPTALDVRAHGFGERDGPPMCMLRFRGPRNIVFHFADRAYVSMSERVDSSTGEVGWYVRVEAKHRELYGEGIRAWLDRWLGLWSWLLFGEWTHPFGLQKRGWSLTQLHLNSDFVGIGFDSEDESDFVASRKRSETGHSCRRASDVAICIYRKGDQLREEKRLVPASSAYAPTWVSHGWRGSDVDGDPVRVEFRLRKKALQFPRADAETDEVLEYDFRNPALLLDAGALRHLWVHVSQARRLVRRDVLRLWPWLVVGAPAITGGAR